MVLARTEWYIKSVVVADDEGYNDIAVFANADGVEYYVKTNGSGLDSSAYEYGATDPEAPEAKKDVRDRLQAIACDTIEFLRER